MERENRFPSLSPDTWDIQESRLRQPLALILSDKPSEALDKLTSQRCAAALPFAGKYRLIDFSLSNCVNSGIETIGVITQYQPRSLHMHLAYGRPWDLDRREGGLTLLHPYQARTGIGWYTGTADAIYQNRDFISHYQVDEVFVFDSSQVCSLDLNVLIAQHRRTKADLTIAATTVDAQTATRHPTLAVDHAGRVHDLVPPGADAPGPLAAMGVLLCSADALDLRLREDAQQPNSTHDIIRDLIPRMLRAGDRVMAFHYTGYWSSIQTAHDYWRASMDLLSENPGLNLQDAAWPIRTRPEVRPPTRVSARTRVSHSLVCEGCVVDGTVEYSILSPGVSVAPGAIVRNSIVMHNTAIEERAIVEHAILDMDVIVGPQAHVGKAHRHAPRIRASAPPQLTVVEKGAHIPGQERVSAGALDKSWLLAAKRQDVPSERTDAA